MSFGPSGTSQSLYWHWSNYPVLEDYIATLRRAVLQRDTVLAVSLGAIIGSQQPQGFLLPDVSEALQLLGPEQPIALVVLNSLGWNRTELVEVLVPSLEVVVEDETGKTVQHQVVPDEGGQSTGTLYLMVQIDALSIRTYFVRYPRFNESSWGPKNDPNIAWPTEFPVGNGAKDFTLQSDVLQVTFSRADGGMRSVAGTPVDQRFLQCHNGIGGAYILVETNGAIPLTELPRTT